MSSSNPTIWICLFDAGPPRKMGPKISRCLQFMKICFRVAGKVFLNAFFLEMVIAPFDDGDPSKKDGKPVPIWVDLTLHNLYFLSIFWADHCFATKNPTKKTPASLRRCDRRRPVSSFKLQITYCWWFTNPVVVEVGSLSQYLLGFSTIPGGWPWDFWTINRIVESSDLKNQTMGTLFWGGGSFQQSNLPFGLLLCDFCKHHHAGITSSRFQPTMLNMRVV